MAENRRGLRKPRVRKSAPTVRQRVEASAEQEEKQTGPVRRTASKAASPVRRLRLRDRKVFKIIAKPFKLLGRGLRRITPKYLINAWREVRLVVWPNRRETWRLTAAVFVFALVFGALVAGVDKILDEIFKKVVLK